MEESGEIMSTDVVKSVVTDDSSFEELIRVYKFFSRLGAVLPFEGRDFNFIGTRLITVIMLVSTFVDLGMLVGYDLDAIIQGRPLKVADVYVPILAIGGFFRYYTLMWFRKDNAALFEECGRLWQFCNAKGRATVKSYERRVRSIYGIYACSCFMANTLIPIDAYMTRLPPIEPNGTERRVLPFSWFVEDEPYKYLGYHATFIIQSIVVQNCILTALVCDGAIPAFIMLGAAYFHQLNDRLADCCEEDPLTQNTEVMRCFKYHQRLFKYCKNVSDLSQTMLLTEIIVSCYSVSLILIKLIGSDADKYSHVPIAGICMCQLFLVNWTPDLLADQSEQVAFAAYSILMKRLDDKRYSRNLHIMLIRAQTPVLIMAGGFVVLSLENYGSMMNKAFSFFMVLRTFDVQ